MICEKVNMLHADLKDSPGTSAESDNLRLVVGGSINLRKEVTFIV